MKKTFTLIVLCLAAHFAFGQISGVSPNQGNRGQTLPIIISGSNGNFTSQGSGTTIWLQQGSFVIGPGSSTTNQGSVVNNIANVTVVNSSTLSADVSIPQNAPTGFYNVSAESQNTVYTDNSGFEVLQGSYTGLSMKIGGGKPGNTVKETFTWIDEDLTGQTINSLWLSLNGQTILCSNPTIVTKNTNVEVTINIPANAESGYWNVNMISSSGDLFMSTAAFHIDQAFSVPELELINITMFPIPAQGFINIDLSEVNEPNMKLRIIDVSGRLMMNDEVLNRGVIERIDISALPIGIYFIQVESEGRLLKSEKVIKQ